ncbi:sensor signal transduction histidine kinase [Gottschalkia acidurici 9a]|uniref:histidine kinase n=1 Tax=Gottschalkia acidurici (strain ATCC 7906 / DSM 604 / BCRC 14475 / CIP 104303 / KCTC 5404 / NCIMB 10678 / 9a) TaxID=1128398 RepID=K0AYB2_GOTA9|nr:sensor histidine kinase [Gottschalkia acidurici]AFS77366.1 sensor signal transduction histidine kinase [Gottschalkia acidurici 9a]
MIENIIYSFILVFVLLVFAIILDYMKKKSVYDSINYGLDAEYDMGHIFNIPDNISHEHDIFKKLLVNNYMNYEDTLEKYKKNYKTQMDFKSRWIHQMKTPVSVIKLMLENEKDKTTEKSTRRSYESIEEEIEKLSHGLEMALYTLRVNDFELDFKVEEVEILDVVRGIINENKNTFIMNSIYPKITSSENIKVKSDKKWIKFVLSQIICNSIKYSKVKKSDNKAIKISLDRSSDRTILSVADQGVGIPKEDIGRVFNSFYTGKNGRKYKESTGMGLYLAKDVCDKLGHDISVESIEGEWTRVNITFYDGKSIYNISE